MRHLKAEIGGYVDVQQSGCPVAPSRILLYHDSHAWRARRSPSHQPRGSIMTLSNTVYSVFSFIGFLFCAIPFTWHFKRKVEPLLTFLHFSKINMNSMLADRNTGTCLFMAWSGITCLYQFINSVIWNGNIVNWSPVWCDIGTVDLLLWMTLLNGPRQLRKYSLVVVSVFRLPLYVFSGAFIAFR
jgi:Pheromone A receptor